MKKVVVTGGAGFIGSHLAEQLAINGDDVIILDNLSTGKMENIEHIIKLKNVSFVEGSILDLPLLEKVFRGTAHIFHHAASISVAESTEDPLKYNESNITGTLNVLLAAKNNKVKKVIFASSSAVYGDPTELPTKEDSSLNPLSPYAISKLVGEYYCTYFNNTCGLPTVCLRYFNVYGPRQDPLSEYASVIAAFIKRIHDGLPPIIHGDGEQSRDFVYIEDVVSANLILADSSSESTWNIGSGTSHTVNKIAEIMINILGSKQSPIYEKARIGDVKHTLPDITRARAMGFVPEWNLHQGLATTIAYSYKRSEAMQK